MSRLILALRALPQPVIAAVNGPAAGFGLALALGCDIRYAAPEAVFRVAFINIGVSNCDMGTSWLLPRLIGASRSHELMLTGRRVDAEEALRIGLVADVVDGRRAARARARGGRADRRAGAVGRAADQARHVDARWRSPPSRRRSSTRTASRSWRRSARAVPEAIGAFLEKRPAEFAD